MRQMRGKSRLEEPPAPEEEAQVAPEAEEGEATDGRKERTYPLWLGRRRFNGHTPDDPGEPEDEVADAGS